MKNKTTKTEVLFTRISKPNNNYLKGLKKDLRLSKARCLDEILSYMRQNGDKTITPYLAKRRNEIREAV